MCQIWSAMIAIPLLLHLKNKAKTRLAYYVQFGNLYSYSPNELHQPMGLVESVL